MTREQLARSYNLRQVADYQRQAARAALTLLVEWEERSVPAPRPAWIKPLNQEMDDLADELFGKNWRD